MAGTQTEWALSVRERGRERGRGRWREREGEKGIVWRRADR